MNALVNKKTQLPAHIQALKSLNASAAVMGGITSGASIYGIGIKGSRWRLQNPQGEEQVVPNHFLDVVIVSANPNRSKVFYLGAYNPADTEFKAPDCYSDNGATPAARALKPQSPSCDTCPHNVWGSKVNSNGSQTKACADSKKLAVLLADNPTGPIYLLKVPAASLKNLYAFAESLLHRDIPLAGIVARLEFDSTADYPKIKFTPQGWASDAQVSAVLKLADSDEVKTVVGLKDAAAPVAQAAIADSQPTPAPDFALPPAGSSFGANSSEPVTAPAPAKRTRQAKPKAEAVFQEASELPEFFIQAPQNQPTSAAAAVQVSPQPTDSVLDELLAKAFSV